MTHLPPARCAADAVRYLYLAGVAQREGHHEAAGRLRAKATKWMERNLPGNAKPRHAPDPLGPGEARSDVP